MQRYAVVCGRRCLYAARCSEYVPKLAVITASVLVSLVVACGAGVVLIGQLVGQAVTAKSPSNATLGDIVLAIDALGVNSEQNFHAVPGPRGNLRRRNSGVEPQRQARVSSVVNALG